VSTHTLRAGSKRGRRPTLAVYKLASCDGCQLSLLDCEDELLELAEVIDIANFAEASRDLRPGPYDLTLVEGSVTTAHDAERLLDIRAESRHLVTIGACATAGGVQALRNLSDADAYAGLVYARPEWVSYLATSTPIAAHVRVDFELRGCPVSKAQLLEVVAAFIAGRHPRIPEHAVCVECKLRGLSCLMITQRAPCMGPVTHAGCGALCPSYSRACFGCFGPQDTANPGSLTRVLSEIGLSPAQIRRSFHAYHVGSPSFLEAGLAAHQPATTPAALTDCSGSEEALPRTASAEPATTPAALTDCSGSEEAQG
jgi:sulfhydrogenase subunit delta